MKTKQWRCGSGEHVVGLVVWNGNDVPQLWVYRRAVRVDPRSSESGNIPDDGYDATLEKEVVAAYVTGRAPVNCDLCGSTRLWDITPDALVEIFKHLDAGQVFEFSKKLLEKS